jgi:hypothetical protein
MINHLDRIIQETPCRLSIEDIGDFAFGGFMGGADAKPLFVDVLQAGIALRKHELLPLAVPVPPEIGFFLAAWAAERLQDERISDGDMGIDEVGRRIEKIERKRGVRDGLVPWRADKAPADWKAANREWERIADEIFVDTLRPYAADMAELFFNDLAKFDRRREVGRQILATLLGREDVLRPLEEVLSEVLEDE